MEEKYGARIERGKIIRANEGKYTVASLDRPGIIAEGMQAISGNFEAGEMVAFFMFRDGIGKIISKL